MHPRLAPETARSYAFLAAAGLERHGHLSGVDLAILIDGGTGKGQLHWTGPSLVDADVLDFQRVTEDAAEAISLALVHIAMGWVIRRRLQRGKFADWLMHDRDKTTLLLKSAGSIKLTSANGAYRLSLTKSVARKLQSESCLRHRASVRLGLYSNQPKYPHEYRISLSPSR